MLEVGRAGTAGTEKGVVPVLRDGAVVAALRTSNWKEQATAVVGVRQWLFSRRKGELAGRWTVDPQGTARLRARQVSYWKGTWSADLEGTQVEVATLSYWKATHRFLAGGQQVAHSGSTGGWSPLATLTAAPEVPLDHQVFLLWLELVVSRRNTAGLAVVTAGAGVGGMA
ncbi:hypothetical protein [Candidatus Blastococcus massiliensis]|uniref:hypothetical protein n=1 Tax=Candidatus Blastococcus massiliensis TaxID=1470358 RepID=UPI0004B8EB7A|nr:hypothetical protein [Candidatus Blastococcus massiliensis]